MIFSPDTLQAFTQAASCGSLSAAARRLGKSQSTISEAVARLELDLGVSLFERGPRRLQLTPAGASLLLQAEQVLSAHDRLNHHAAGLARGQEARLTLALSDAYQPQQYEARLQELDRHYPDLQFECVLAEQDDVIDLVSQGRAQIGLLAARSHYPGELAHARLAQCAEFALYVAASHPLAAAERVSQSELQAWRQLRLSSVSTGASSQERPTTGSPRVWTAPDYLLLLDMARQGFGWTELPRELVACYDSSGQLHELPCNGWPRQVAVDAVWSRQRPCGPIAAWLLERLLH